MLRSLQQKRGTDELFLLDRKLTPPAPGAAAEEEPEPPPNLIRVPLSECDRAMLAQFLEPRIVRLDGEPLLLPLGRGYITTVDRGQDSERLELSPAWLAARELAACMDGEVVEIDDPTPFGLLPLPEDAEGDVLPIAPLEVASEEDAEGVERSPIPSEEIPPAPGLGLSVGRPDPAHVPPEVEDLAIEAIPPETGEEKPYHQQELILWGLPRAVVDLEEESLADPPPGSE